jgi:tRNA threonylcarbamoyladenosine biosynthesis protein TsaB
MKILALELSSARGSIALLDGEKLEFNREWPNDRKNSGPFFEYVAEVRKQFGKAATIIVGLGPGSYAGARIAISAAIGLSFGGRRAVSASPARSAPDLGRDSACPSIRLIGFPSICAIECVAAEYCVIGDARRQTFFFARIRDNNLAEGPALMSEAELREKLDKVGSKMSIFATENLPQFERADIRYPSAKILARFARDADRNFAQPPLEPMYLREPHVTVPKK